MDLTKPLPYFRVERYSHHFVVKEMSPLGQRAAETFVRNYIQYGMIKTGRMWRRGPIRVFAAKVNRENEIRLHVGQWDAWKTFLANTGISPLSYTEVEYGLFKTAPLNAAVKEGWNAFDYQVPIIKYLIDPLPSTRKLVEIQPGKGKSQPGYSLVRVPEGWKRMDKIQVGDKVLSPDGNVSTVQEVYENGMRPMLRLIGEDGRSAVADKEHLWRINYYQEGKLTSCVVNSDHIRVLVESGKKVYLPLPAPDPLMGTAVDIDEGFAEDVWEGKPCKERLVMLELQSYFARSEFLKQLLQHAEIDTDEGTVTLRLKEPNDELETVFRACGFIITWVPDPEVDGLPAATGKYSIWGVNIADFFEDRKEDIQTASDVRGEFYGVQITQVEKVGDEEAFCILVDHPLHLYVTNDYMITHNTFCASSAIAHMGQRMIAFLRPKYLEKWVRDLKAIMDIDPEDIEVIRGGASLMQVISKAREGTLNCKAILVSNRTYQHYITSYEKEGKALLDQGYDCLPHEFIQLAECGVRLVDEVHQDFHLNFKIDLYTHVASAISLSATLVDDDAFITRMHETAYDPDIRYNGLEYDKYVDSYSFNYRIKGGEYLRTTEVGSNNYSHMAFEKNFYKNQKLLAQYLQLIEERMVKRYLDRKSGKQRCLIYAASIQMCTLICDYLKRKHPNLDIRRYVEDDPYDNLMGAEVCVSTIGSAGTGHDIPDLITVLLTVAISSKASNIQGFGRLRKLSGIDVVFEYFTCLDIPKHVEYQERKERLLATMAKSNHTETLDYALG